MVRVLFVCMGNICRSPAAEGIFKKLVQDKGLENTIICDSAGTVSYHAGEPADHRMRAHAKERGYLLSSISRGVRPESDFTDFDYILAMDSDNFEDLNSIATEDTCKKRIYMMTDFAQELDVVDVPDPYYGDKSGFDRVLDILEDSCMGLLKKIESEIE